MTPETSLAPAPQDQAVDINKGGRPSLYRPEFCDQLVKLMASGLSKDACAGEFNVSRDTIYEWVKVHPEFAEAMKIAEAKSLLFYERLGRNGAMGKVSNFNAGAWIFIMKNRWKWTDRLEHLGDPEHPVTFAALASEAKKLKAQQENE